MDRHHVATDVLVIGGGMARRARAAGGQALRPEIVRAEEERPRSDTREETSVITRRCDGRAEQYAQRLPRLGDRT
jgi:hypothetical protein